MAAEKVGAFISGTKNSFSL